MKKKTQIQFQMMDNNSRYSIMFGELIALDTKCRISAGRIGELKSLTSLGRISRTNRKQL